MLNPLPFPEIASATTILDVKNLLLKLHYLNGEKVEAILSTDMVITQRDDIPFEQVFLPKSPRRTFYYCFAKKGERASMVFVPDKKCSLANASTVNGITTEMLMICSDNNYTNI